MFRWSASPSIIGEKAFRDARDGVGMDLSARAVSSPATLAGGSVDGTSGVIVVVIVVIGVVIVLIVAKVVVTKVAYIVDEV